MIYSRQSKREKGMASGEKYVFTLVDADEDHSLKAWHWGQPWGMNERKTISIIREIEARGKIQLGGS